MVEGDADEDESATGAVGADEQAFDPVVPRVRRRVQGREAPRTAVENRSPRPPARRA